MEHPTTGHHDSGEHSTPHLPDPSAWPFIAGLAALVVGIALVWWARDRDHDFTGPLLGAAAVIVLLSAAGWAWEDSRMRKKAESHELGTRDNPRYTQVITFAVNEGQLAAARDDGGVLAAIESSPITGLGGYQDLRITVTPEATGPSQVLVESTWTSRAGLAGYDEGRQTILDILNRFPEQVAAGSVQAFDMEVVRDTKDVAFRFGLGTAAALIGSLVVGGFMIGAGLTTFESDKAVAEGGAEPPPSNNESLTDVTVIATDNKFDKKTIRLAADADVKVTIENDGKVPHNINFLNAKGGQTLVAGAKGEVLNGGKSETLAFKTPPVGSYYFQCDLHPTEMFGTAEVVAAPAGGN